MEAVVARSSTSTDYKDDQRRQWDEAAGFLRGWWPAFERVMEPVTRVMVSHAELRAGAGVVDVASGFGEPALTVAGLVGPLGHVVATDLSEAMLAMARERAAALGVTNVAFAQMDAEEPFLSGRRYDAVTCRLGLMLLPHLDVALERLTALLVPGGRFVAAVWGPPEANPWLAGALGTLREFLELPVAPGGLGPFGLAAAGQLEGALAGAGLARVHLERVPLRFGWSSPAAYTAFHEASPMRRLLDGQRGARRDEAWAEVRVAALRRWGSGPLRLPGEVLVATGYASA